MCARIDEVPLTVRLPIALTFWHLKKHAVETGAKNFTLQPRVCSQTRTKPGGATLFPPPYTRLVPQLHNDPRVQKYSAVPAVREFGLQHIEPPFADLLR